MSKDIIQLEANTMGCDYIIADAHGKREGLDSVFKKLALKDNDRLFIAGDLVDRGEDSLGVIEAIVKSDRNIHVIRGNHEEMTLSSIKALEEIIAALKESGVSEINEETVLTKMDSMLDDPLISKLEKHVRDNGGMWILKLFAKEHTEGKLSLSPSESKIRMVEKFMGNLPYIITVKGTDTVSPFNVVHADMPINDEELKRRLSKDGGLTDDEKHYAVWARESSYDPEIGRTPYSIDTYCGHNIIGYDETECVREYTSSIDLDFAAYLTNVFLVVNHTRRTAFHVRNPSQVVDANTMSVARQFGSEIKSHLVAKVHMEQLRKMLNDFALEMHAATQDNISAVYEKWVNKIDERIRSLPDGVKVDRWDAADLLIYTLANSDASSGIIRNVMEKLIVYFVETSKGKIKTPEAMEMFSKSIRDIARAYNFYHQPQDILRFDDLEQQVGFVRTAPITSKKGMFAQPSNPGKFEQEKLEILIQLECEGFAEEKKKDYETMTSQSNGTDLNVMVKDAIELIAALNSQIRVHNEKYSDYAFEPLFCETFYKNNEADGLYIDLSNAQCDYVKKSLMIEDLKNKLLVEITKCTNEEDVSNKIGKYCEKLMTLLALTI